MFGSKKQTIAVEQIKHKRESKKFPLNDLAPSPRGVNPSSAKRRGAFIHVYVGKNGSGKSLAMMYDTLPDLRAGKKVLSSMPILAFERADTPEQAEKAWADIGMLDVRPQGNEDDELRLPHPQWVPFNDWRLLMDFRDGVILMDEISGIADARESSSMPVQVTNKLPQLRRNNVVLRITSIDWSVLDKRLRELCIAVTICTGYWGKTIPGSMWQSKRLFRYKTYDAKGFNDFTSAINRVSQKQRPRVKVGQWVFLKRGLAEASDSYSSLAPVLMVGTANEAGMCLTCGGRRSAPRCDCEKDATASRKGKKTMTSPASDSEAVGMDFSRSEGSAVSMGTEGELLETQQGTLLEDAVTFSHLDHLREDETDECGCHVDEPVFTGGRHSRIGVKQA